VISYRAQHKIDFIKHGIARRGQISLITRKTISGGYDPSQLASPASTTLTWSLLIAPVSLSGTDITGSYPGTNTIFTIQAAYIQGGTDYSPIEGDVITLEKDYRITKILNDYLIQGTQTGFLVQIEV
jgi:hypothetical protein